MPANANDLLLVERGGTLYKATAAEIAALAGAKFPAAGAEPTFMEFFTDFVNSTPWDSFWTDANSNGALTLSTPSSISPRVGAFIFSTGTNAAGRRHAISGQNTFLPTAGRTIEMSGVVRFPAQASSAQPGEHIFGLVESITATPTRSACFMMDWSGSAVRFRTYSRNNGTPEENSLTVPGTSDWVRLDIRINGVTNIEYRVNGTLVGTHTTMPTSPMQSAAGTRKTSGTTAITTEIDWMAFRMSGIPSPRV